MLVKHLLWRRLFEELEHHAGLRKSCFHRKEIFAAELLGKKEAVAQRLLTEIHDFDQGFAGNAADCLLFHQVLFLSCLCIGH